MTYIKKSVPRAEGSPGLGIQPQDALTVIDVADVAYMPEPDGKGVVIADNIVLKPGKYGYTVYMTPGTIELTSAAEGDPDKIGFKPGVKFSHPGNTQDVREFKVNHVNRKVIAVITYGSGKPSDLIGSPNNPCTVVPSYTGNNDGSATEFTIAQISKGDDIKMYKGTVPVEEPVATVATGSTSVSVSHEGQYQLTAGEATVAELQGGVDGMVVTLLGCAGVAPVVANTAGKVLLHGAKSWTATDGSQLTLRAFSQGESLIWIEQSRYMA